jgi:hypothetical protein
MRCASCIQIRSVFKSTVVTTGVSWENVNTLTEIVVELMVNDTCYSNICPILDGYRVTMLRVLEFQEVKVSCFFSHYSHGSLNDRDMF